MLLWITASYQRICEIFQTAKKGILDHNPDVNITISYCDAYVGETASSMIHMFGMAGKPRFYLNMINYKREEILRSYFYLSLENNDVEYFIDEANTIGSTPKATQASS